jgi:hypothetical protein
MGAGWELDVGEYKDITQIRALYLTDHLSLSLATPRHLGAPLNNNFN